MASIVDKKKVGKKSKLVDAHVNKDFDEVFLHDLLGYYQIVKWNLRLNLCLEWIDLKSTL